MVRGAVHPVDSPSSESANSEGDIEAQDQRPNTASSTRSWSVLDGFFRSMSFGQRSVPPLGISKEKYQRDVVRIDVETVKGVGAWVSDDDLSSQRSLSSHATSVEDLLSGRTTPASVARNLLSQEQLDDWKRIQDQYAHLSSFHAPAPMETKTQGKGSRRRLLRASNE
mmetsp:Transcript_31976/g.64835  ORF Transcript_31976/g.64835 Transcript_31976/m.64835 type:complete len:168 (+) Transcript_31976:68-571(+)